MGEDDKILWRLVVVGDRVVHCFLPPAFFFLSLWCVCVCACEVVTLSLQPLVCLHVRVKLWIASPSALVQWILVSAVSAAWLETYHLICILSRLATCLCVLIERALLCM